MDLNHPFLRRKLTPESIELENIHVMLFNAALLMLMVACSAVSTRRPYICHWCTSLDRLSSYATP